MKDGKDEPAENIRENTRPIKIAEILDGIRRRKAELAERRQEANAGKTEHP